MRRLFTSLLVASSLWALPSHAFDDASQCPGGNSPRGDITNCFTYDEGADVCRTGQEQECMVANGYNEPVSRGYRVVRDGTAAVGAGFFRETPAHGSSGSFIAFNLDARGAREFALRYYVRFGDGYADYTIGNAHTNLVTVRNGNAPCGNSLNIDGDQRAYIAVRGGCGAARLLWNDNLTNGRWYMIELYGRMDTACSDVNSPTGCNGYFAAYLDGEKKFENTTWNWSGGSSAAFFQGFQLPRNYYQGSFPAWRPTVEWDNIVAGIDSRQRIGAADAENARGRANAKSYFINAGADPFVHVPGANARSLRPRGDCSAASDLSIGFSSSFTRGLMSLDAQRTAGVRNWVQDTECAYRTQAVDGSVQLVIPPTATGGPAFLYAGASGVIGTEPLASAGHDSFTGGYLLVDRTAPMTDRPVLAGHASGGPRCGGQFCQWIGLTIDDGHWALAERYTMDGAASTVFARGPVATTGVWHSFEVGVFKNGRADLWIDGVKVISQAQIPNAPGGANNGGFVGISHLVDRSATFRTNFDEIYWSNISREACYGDWGSDCPAAALGSSRPPQSGARPLPPSELR